MKQRDSQLAGLGPLPTEARQSSRKMDQTIEPAKRIEGRLTVPGDKSVTHRGLILSAMAAGRSSIRKAAPGKDVISTAECLQILGVQVSDLSRHDIEVEGQGWRVAGAADLDAGNSGTTMRLLTGALAGRSGTYRLEGDESLTARPMDRVAEPLRLMGAGVDLREGRYPPVTLKGGPLQGVSYRSPVASAQVKGAVLLAGLQAQGPTRVTEPSPSRDHTERLLQWLGVNVSHGDATVELTESDALPLPSFELIVPGDFSSAAYLLVAACIAPYGDMVLEDVGTNPSRTGLLDVLLQMGSDLETETLSQDPEPKGLIRARSSRFKGTEVGGELTLRTIDELPLVALTATQAEGTTEVRDASELRIKEADRIGVLAEGLRELGARIEELPDGFVVTGPTRLSGGKVDPQGDHRLALTFAVAGLIAEGPVVISGWECTAVSFPKFEETLKAVAK